MKPIGEEQQEVASALNDRAVVDYLLQHPEFFIRNAAQVEHLRVPHPVRGSISLVEWHMMRARNHIHVLEENMSLLMEQAVANESLFQRLLCPVGENLCCHLLIVLYLIVVSDVRWVILIAEGQQVFY